MEEKIKSVQAKVTEYKLLIKVTLCIVVTLFVFAITSEKQSNQIMCVYTGTLYLMLAALGYRNLGIFSQRLTDYQTKMAAKR